MKRVSLRGVVVAGMLVAAPLALPAVAGAQDGLLPDAPGASEAPAPQAQQLAAPGDAAPFDVSIDLKGVKNGKVDVGDRVKAIGRVRPFVPGQRVTLTLVRKGKALQTKDTLIHEVRGANYGSFKLRTEKLLKAGHYRIRVDKERTDNQVGGNTTSQDFSLRYPDLDPGDSSEAVKTFNRLLRKQGYFAPGGKQYSAGTGRAVMAFRKVNGMARSFNATAGIFATLAAGKGAFKLKYPGAGQHVEVSIAKQVLVLAKNGKPQYTFHVSTGAPATPSDRGHFNFYSKTPGFNSKGMYYSVYYNRGEATHGYASVPSYPASHGCVRNPIPNSVFIYNWIDLGMDVWVY
jgi:peptidoglycan hydrolase-like protein with peptidoglycan-binding domain